MSSLSWKFRLVMMIVFVWLTYGQTSQEGLFVVLMSFVLGYFLDYGIKFVFGLFLFFAGAFIFDR